MKMLAHHEERGFALTKNHKVLARVERTAQL